MPESYSVNQLKTWSKCNKKYELDSVRRLQWPSNPKNFRLGKGVHQLLDYESRSLPLKPILDCSDTDIVLVWEHLHDSRWAQLPILASEWGFSLEVGGSWIYGRIDRIVKDGDIIKILDWKTGTGIPIAPKEDWQRVYLYAVFEAQPDLGLSIQPEQLNFTYVQVKGQAIQEVEIPYTQAMHQETAQRLISTIRTIENTEVYTLPPACPDRYCPYRKICGIEAKGHNKESELDFATAQSTEE
jgi:CRISPR/Cas system-associated exonuclease Cas4 (RecB family)